MTRLPTRLKAYQRGKNAERLAAWYLRLKGYRILEQRYAARRGSRAGEIDLIAWQGRSFVFVEVKARSSLESARNAISPRQQARIRAAAQTYHAKHAARQGGKSPGGRFDAIFITPGRWGLPRITHIKNAWQ